MTNQLYIDGTDVKEWGITLVKGCYEALLTPPPVKDLITNSSRMEHGKRVIVGTADMKYKDRNVTLNLFLEGETEDDYLGKLRGFMTKLMQGELAFYVPRLRTTYHFVYSQISSYGDYGVKKGKFALELNEPNPDNRQYNENIQDY